MQVSPSFAVINAPRRVSALRCLVLGALVLAGCDDETTTIETPGTDPATAPRVAIDRFSDEAGVLMRRSADPTLPGPNEPIDFDAFFYVRALGPNGEPAAYFSLDAQAGQVMEVHRIVDEDGAPIPEQLPIVPAIVGQQGYSDFWHVIEHEAPSGYVANTITNLDDLMAEQWPHTPTFEAYNRPLVPAGSVADLRVMPPEEETAEALAWFDDSVATYLTFAEAPLAVRGAFVPYSKIYVCFDLPPSADGMPQSGFCTEDDGSTHNVLETVPEDEGYSPLWTVVPYDAASFDDVRNLDTALAAPLFESIGMVNCPIATP